LFQKKTFGDKWHTGLFIGWMDWMSQQPSVSKHLRKLQALTPAREIAD